MPQDRRSIVKELRSAARLRGVEQVRDDAGKEKVLQMVHVEFKKIHLVRGKESVDAKSCHTVCRGVVRCPHLPYPCQKISRRPVARSVLSRNEHVEFNKIHLVRGKESVDAQSCHTVCRDVVRCPQLLYPCQKRLRRHFIGRRQIETTFRKMTPSKC